MSTLSQFFASVGPSGHPFIFPTLFGSGKDGALTASNVSDAGLKTFGLKEYTNLTIPAGVTWTLPAASTNGGLVIAAKNKVTIAGSIVANGGNGGVADIATSGSGGGGAGGAAGGTGRTTNGIGSNTNQWTSQFYMGMANGGTSGGLQINNAAVSTGGSVNQPLLPTTMSSPELLHMIGVVSAANGFRGNPTGAAGSAVTTRSITGTAITAAASGTVAAVSAFVTATGQGPGTANIFPRDPIGGIGGHGGGVTGTAGQTAAGGGGGGGGGVVYIEADTIELVSGYSISCNGGNGSAGYSSNGTTAVGGGGGGGSGGLVLLVCRNLIGSTAAITVNGGTGAAGAGTSAATGLAGFAGTVLVMRV